MRQDSATIQSTRIPAGTWTVDAGRTELGFAVRTLWGAMNVRGRFERFTGDLSVSPDGARGELRIDAASLDTGNRKRDEHLRSADFFDVQTSPDVTFTLASLDTAADGLTVKGDLRIGSTSLALTLPVSIESAGDGALRIRTAITIPRERAGLGFNRIGMLGGDAHLSADITLAHG
jgi:polyisoprenoid-binding protein YceI